MEGFNLVAALILVLFELCSMCLTNRAAQERSGRGMSEYFVFLYFIYYSGNVQRNHTIDKMLSLPQYGTCATPNTMTRKTHKHTTDK